MGGAPAIGVPAPVTDTATRRALADDARRVAGIGTQFAEPLALAVANGIRLDDLGPVACGAVHLRETAWLRWCWDADPRLSGWRAAERLAHVLLARGVGRHHETDAVLLASELLWGSSATYVKNIVQAERLQRHAPRWLLAIRLGDPVLALLTWRRASGG